MDGAAWTGRFWPPCVCFVASMDGSAWTGQPPNGAFLAPVHVCVCKCVLLHASVKERVAGCFGHAQHAPPPHTHAQCEGVRPMSVGHVRAGYKYRPGAGCWVRSDLLAWSHLSSSCASRQRIKCSCAFRHALSACGRSPISVLNPLPENSSGRGSADSWKGPPDTVGVYASRTPDKAQVAPFGKSDCYNGPVLVLCRLGPHCGTIPPGCLRSPPA